MSRSRRRRALRSIAATVPLLLLGSCGDALLSASESRALAAAESTWRSHGYDTYAFDYRESCFCGPGRLAWVRITVAGGAVQQVVYADSTSVALLSAGWPTIDGLFAQLHDREHARGGVTDHIDAVFEPTIGYPASVDFVPRSGVLDAGFRYEVREVVPLQTH